MENVKTQMRKEFYDMAKKYLIKVNGKMYEVEVEEMGNVFAEQKTSSVEMPSSVAMPSTPKSESREPIRTETVKTETVTEDKSAGLSDGVEEVVAPMSGVVLKVNVHPGDVVKDAQTLMIIEAMKMENEILAPHDGKIKDIFVKEGQQIEIDEVLLTIE